MAPIKKPTETEEPKGFWSQDEDFGRRLDEEYEEGEAFLCLSVRQDTPFVHPDTGEIIDSRTALLTHRLDAMAEPIGFPIEVKTLAKPIYTRAGSVQEGDFPAIVRYKKVDVKKWKNEATVLERICPWPIPDALRAQLGGPVHQLALPTGD